MVGAKGNASNIFYQQHCHRVLYGNIKFGLQKESYIAPLSFIVYKYKEENIIRDTVV